MVARETGASTIHLIAHSTGSRALAKALASIARNVARGQPVFHQVVFAAADIDAEIFRTQLAPAITNVGKRTTLYVSAGDRALLVSKKIRRFGATPEPAKLATTFW
jgi:esterase/lipase superfamily enzyme